MTTVAVHASHPADAIMTRQAMPRDARDVSVSGGSTAGTRLTGNLTASDTAGSNSHPRTRPPQAHQNNLHALHNLQNLERSSSSVVSPLSLPGPVHIPYPSASAYTGARPAPAAVTTAPNLGILSLDSIHDPGQSVPVGSRNNSSVPDISARAVFAASSAVISAPVPAPLPVLASASSTNTQTPSHLLSPPLPYAAPPRSSQILPRSSRSRAPRPTGSTYRSVSANPTTRGRYYPVSPPLPTGPRSAIASPAPPPSSGGRSSSASDRATILMIEAERASWEAEKAGYVRQIEVLRQILQQVMRDKDQLQQTLDEVTKNMQQEGGENLERQSDAGREGAEDDGSPTILPGVAPSQAIPALGTFVSRPAIPGPGDSSANNTSGAMKSQAAGPSAADTAPVPNKITTATPMTAAGIAAAVASPPVGMVPQSYTAAAQAVGAGSGETMDVSTINPELEGIRLRAAAVQRPTFSIHSPSSPPTIPRRTSISESIQQQNQQQEQQDSQAQLEPPQEHEEAQEPQQESGQQQEPQQQQGENGSNLESSSTPRQDQQLDYGVCKSSKAQTLHVLATAESGRRRMHAGHTPSHSVAHFPETVAEEVAEAGLKASISETGGVDGRGVIGIGDTQHEIPVFEPDDDRPLTGHLMMQSDGATSAEGGRTKDPFLDAFTRKLEGIERGEEDGVPSVVRNREFVESGQARVQDEVISGTAPVDGEAAGLTGGGDEEREGRDDFHMDAEAEIPLKLKSTTNFGLPWGKLGRARSGSEV